MAHLMSKDGKKRISLDTLVVKPGVLEVGVSGMIPSLSLVLTDDPEIDTNKLKPGDLRPQIAGKVIPKTKADEQLKPRTLPNTDITVIPVAIHNPGIYRLELRSGIDA